MFSCKVCREKDLRIQELKDQISYFKNLLNPPPRINKYELEADTIMNGAGNETEQLDPIDAEAEALENERIQREEDMIFSGNTIETQGT